MPVLKQSDVRRTFSPEFKWQLVQESKERVLSVSELARKYDVNTNQVFRWVREVNVGKALWVKRAKGEVDTPAESDAVAAVDTLRGVLRRSYRPVIRLTQNIEHPR